MAAIAKPEGGAGRADGYGGEHNRGGHGACPHLRTHSTDPPLLHAAWHLNPAAVHHSVSTIVSAVQTINSAGVGVRAWKELGRHQIAAAIVRLAGRGRVTGNFYPDRRKHVAAVATPRARRSVGFEDEFSGIGGAPPHTPRCAFPGHTYTRPLRLAWGREQCPSAPWRPSRRVAAVSRPLPPGDAVRCRSG